LKVFKLQSKSNMLQALPVLGAGKAGERASSRAGGNKGPAPAIEEAVGARPMEGERGGAQEGVVAAEGGVNEGVASEERAPAPQEQQASGRDQGKEGEVGEVSQHPSTNLAALVSHFHLN
jgi:hypothetical protein